MAYPWVTDLNQTFQNVYLTIASTRQDLNLPPLQPIASGSTANFLFGHEFVVTEHTAPRIIIVPIRGEFDFSATMPLGPITDDEKQQPRKPIYREWAVFQAWIWGDPGVPVDLTIPNGSYDFNSTYELRREFISAFYDTVTGGSFRPDSAEWVQDSDMNRYGRVYVLNFRVAVPVTQEAFLYLNYSTTSGDGGVEGHTAVTMHSPDGENPQVTGIVIIAPPK